MGSNCRCSGPPSFAHECRRWMPASMNELPLASQPSRSSRRRPLSSIVEPPLSGQAKVCRNRHFPQQLSSQPRQRAGRLVSFTHGSVDRIPGLSACTNRRMTSSHVVYILRSLTEPHRPYIGVTRDLDARLEAHNAGRCTHTARHSRGESWLPSSSLTKTAPSASSAT